MNIFFSNRIKALSNCLNFTSSVADIGCDHGYTSIYIIQKRKAEKVIACDINSMPLEKAKSNILKLGLEEHIETRISDGFLKIDIGEIDSAIISGMGGILIIDILKKSPEIVSSLKQLIIQPQRDIYSVRQFIHSIGFYIDDEQMVYEDDKYYNIISTMPGYETYTEKEYLLGKKLIDKKDIVLKQFILWQLNVWENISRKLSTANSEDSIRRLSEITNLSKIYKETCSEFQLQ